MFRLRAPDNSTLRALIDRSASASPTYAEIGATRDKHSNTDNTMFSIVVFSKPAVLVARIGRPIARSIQQRVTHAYADALRDHVCGAG